MKKLVSILLSCGLLIGFGQANFMYEEFYAYNNSSLMGMGQNHQSFNGSTQNDLLEGDFGGKTNTRVCIDKSGDSRSLVGSESCIEYCSSHGPGRESGGVNLLDSGCRNYMGWGYEHYGAVDIPYWINQASMSTMSADHKALLLEDIRAQSELWNNVKMHDGSGQLINLYEVGNGLSMRPSNINGKQVVEILRLDGNYAGQFSPSALQIRINYDSSAGGVRPGRNIDTPMHEMGHLLGLYDLDSSNEVPSGTHRVLMGYNRGTTEETLDQAIKYQDIQGVAVANNCHTIHQYTRYVKNGNKYSHICFYCDMIEEKSAPISGSGAMGDLINCNHDYGAMVSAGERIWLKCSKCYKVIETTTSSHSNLFDGGKGTVSDPYLISTAEQFNNIRLAHTSVAVPNVGYEQRITYSFKLMNSLTLPGDWVAFPYVFTGNFDGNGRYISYQTYLTQGDINGSMYHGLFGFVAGSANIHDLELMNCSITSNTDSVLTGSGVCIGILAGAFYDAGYITNVTVTNPNITCLISDTYIGGLVGSTYYTSIENCVIREQNGTASITNNASSYIGGMAGTGEVSYFSGGSVTIALTNTAFDEEIDRMGEVVATSTAIPSGMTANVTMDKGSCIVAGSLITLSDGRQVPVETLTGEEMLLVWNLHTGTFDEAPILFLDFDSFAKYTVVRLTFSDGTELGVVSEHGLWDCNLNEYVYLDKDAAQYLGHTFLRVSSDGNGNRISTQVTLVDVEVCNEFTAVYSPVTEGHLCYYVNGMLSMPGGIEGLFNIFEVDGDRMAYDEGQMQADIAQYGLYTYEEFAQFVPVSEEAFDALGGQYLKVAVGKGLIDVQTLEALALRYGEYLV